jgi:mannose-1-phosphate guanylyltransferase
MSVCGEDVHINDELFINGSFILPHRQITQSILTKGTVMM